MVFYLRWIKGKWSKKPTGEKVLIAQLNHQYLVTAIVKILLINSAMLKRDCILNEQIKVYSIEQTVFFKI